MLIVRGIAAENVRPVHVMPGKVLFEFDINRYDSNNDMYVSTPVLWMLTKADGSWAVKFRSIMPRTFPDRKQQIG